MMGKVLPILFLAGGVAAGAAAGLFMRSSGGAQEEPVQTGQAQDAHQDMGTPAAAGETQGSPKFEYLNLTKQFVIPVVERDRISALVTVSLGLEAPSGMGEALYAIEPKLRDEFLQVLFDHANMGGFDGAFTQSDRLDALRQALLNVAQHALGADVARVLILSIARQDT